MPSYPSDKEILDALSQPHSREKAFKWLVGKYKSKIYWTVRRMVIDHDDTNDLVQNIFIKIWKKIDQFRSQSELYTWIYRIAINESLNFIKSKNRKKWIPLDQASSYLEKKVDDYFPAEADRIKNKLYKSISRLPEKQKMVFNLRYFEEKSYDEISQILGVSVGSLKASYHHAVKKIESELVNSF